MTRPTSEDYTTELCRGCQIPLICSSDEGDANRIPKNRCVLCGKVYCWEILKDERR